MFQNLTLFQTAAASARHASQQQSAVALNIANADTPGFKARHMARFSDSFRGAEGMRITRSSHLQPDAAPATIIDRANANPNGNTVSLEKEMVASSLASQDHDRALALYQHGMKILRLSMGRRS